MTVGRTRPAIARENRFDMDFPLFTLIPHTAKAQSDPQIAQKTQRKL
jgi:hypothetical protein